MSLSFHFLQHVNFKARRLRLTSHQIIESRTQPFDELMHVLVYHLSHLIKNNESLATAFMMLRAFSTSSNIPVRVVVL